MSYLRDDEIKRLLAYLRVMVEDEETLASIEDVLRSDEATEYLREPEILAYFPALTETLGIAAVRWSLRVISHAHLRSVQRGISTSTIASLFRRFVEFSGQQNVTLTTGNYAVTARPAPRLRPVTIRFDVDNVSDTQGAAHVVTVVVGVTAEADENTFEI